jgi:sugar/nucleoside kinase (ribokinase family)
MTARVLVVGDVMVDVVVVPDGPIARGTDVRATIRPMPGGSGANQAVWLASMGVEVTFVARIGARDSAVLDAHFRDRGVEPVLASDPALPTGTLICLVEGDGERSFLTDRGANSALCAEDLPQTLLEGIEMLHVSGYALFDPEPRAAVLALIAAAHASGIAVSIDPSSTGFLDEVGPQNFLDWTAGADFLFPNADEAEMLAGQIELNEQMAVLGDLYGTVVINRGAQGAMTGGRGKTPVALPGREVPVLDTTGAGDAFLAGYLASHLRGDDDVTALENAIEAGAKAVERFGAQP